MNAKTKKILKIAAWVVGILLLIPVLLVVTLPLWLGPIARPVVNSVVPQFTKTEFNIDKLYLNPYTCNFEIGGLLVGNPEGFAETNAVTLGYFNIDLETASLFTDVIVIENIEVSDVDFNLVNSKTEKNKTNLDIIQENVLGQVDEAKKQAEEEAEKQRQANLTDEERKAEEESAKLNKKFILKRLSINNIRGKYGMMPLYAPSFELKDIGQDSGGYDADHLVAAVIKEFWASLMASAIDVGNLLGDGAGKTMNALKGVGSLFKKGDDVGKTDDAGAQK